MKYTFLRYAGLKISSIIFVTLMFTGLLIAQEIHKYIDDQGVMHFVDDESLIPEKYKTRSKSVIKREGEPKQLLEEQKEAQPKVDLKGGEVKRDKFGNTPSYWRARFKALQDERLSKERELRSLEEQRSEISKKLESARSKAFFIGDSQSITEAASLENRLRDIENSIKITITALDELNKKISVDIYDELVQAGGDPSWLILGE
ncbi:MAG: hypothetical protein N2202_06450 [Proteobacteria bacterium]|nr:hypothetical protein [Pseudomonadota bacterium]